MSSSAASPMKPSGGVSFAQPPPTLTVLTSTRTRHASFLPIPSPSRVTNIPKAISQSSLSLAYDKPKLKHSNTDTSNATTRSNSISHLQPRENSRLPGPRVIRKMSNNLLHKSPHLPGLSRKSTVELTTNEQAGKSHTSPAAISHSLRRIPRLTRQSILGGSRTHLLSTASMMEPSAIASQRSARSQAVPTQLIYQQPNRSISRGLTPPPRQARKAKSQQELLPKSRPSRRKTSGAQLITPIKQTTQSASDPTSPESLQSNITLTDGGSSIRTRFDYAHEPISAGSHTFGTTRETASTNNFVTKRATDVPIPPTIPDNSLSTSDHRIPPESQPRILILEQLKSLIMGQYHHQNLLNFQAVFQLICQSELYETAQDVEKRAFENSIMYIPQATLEIPTQLTSTSNSSSATTAAYGVGPSAKRLHVGAIILEKLRWVSKNGPGQSFKHAASKSLSKSAKAPSLPSSHPSVKLKYLDCNTPCENAPHSDQKRFSHILGAALEYMDHSTCVVTMGARLHMLPTLPFSVVEEIYRRGMRTPGILRISGDFARVDELVNTFESCPSSGIDLSSEDIHTLCALLKYYLRSLPQPLFHPLLSETLWTLCVKSNRNKGVSPDKCNRTSEIVIARNLLKLLPSRALSLLAYVIPFLAHVPKFSENRIQDESLATMLGPAIFISRNMGFPGLGFLPRTNKTDRTATRQIPARDMTQDSSTYPSSQVEKSEARDRATESTLWMMNNWKSLFSDAYRVGESHTGMEGHIQHMMEAQNELIMTDNSETLVEAYNEPTIEAQNDLIKPFSLPKQQLSLQDTPLFHPQQTRASEIFTNSRPTSFLTYSSGLTGLPRSTSAGESNRSSAQSRVRRSHLSDSDDLQTSTSQYLDQPGNEGDLKRNTLRSSLAVAFPRHSDLKEAGSFHVKEQSELSKSALRKEEKEQKFKQSPSALLKGTAPEEEQKERRYSEKFTKLVAHYLEAREEKINQQESIIESLIEEIGRLQAADEEEEADQRRIFAERCNLHSDDVGNPGEQPYQNIEDLPNSMDLENSDVIPHPGSSNFGQSRGQKNGGEKSQSSLETFSRTVSNRASESNSEPAVANPLNPSSKLNDEIDLNPGHDDLEQIPNLGDPFDDDQSTEHGDQETCSTPVDQSAKKLNVRCDHSSLFTQRDLNISISTFGAHQGIHGQLNLEEEPSELLKHDNHRDTQRLSYLTKRRVDAQHPRSIINESRSEEEACGLSKDDNHVNTRGTSFDLSRISLDTQRLSLGTQQSSRFSSSSSFAAGETASYKAEIARLRLLNAKLIYKLESIERIISASTSNLML